MVALNVLLLRSSGRTGTLNPLSVFTDPLSITEHEGVAQMLGREGFVRGSERERAYIAFLRNTRTNILGAASVQDYQGAVRPDTVLPHALAFWTSVIREKPDYRDAYISLAAIQYQLGDLAGAKTAIRSALSLDPNNKPAREMLTLITGAELP
ncbi:tetratricopeptide repeat protein [Patescibacteria group bacterium]|nr:tetratricopeptide repeat protein [Patescibacteria group bacterium]